ncbi:glutathione-disulfide reductase [Roseiterribacter gracilis]|uniref:Glutathione-disulfide reductase n=1 Tax=Roseiterribacter gracilis TaxID=2812848 RepID=A0A8S8XE39_9PROT|nr:glutathione-disulfide reductase [Rhodospirillales bacterium TMPK1]
MSDFDFDYFVIGAGSGGVRSSRIAATHGARVGVAEDRYLGGTCVNVGCVPKKILSIGAHVRDELQDARGYGWTIPPAAHDWATLIANKDAEIQRLNDVYRGLLDRAGVKLFEAHASFIDPHTLKVGDKQVTAKNILIASGSWPMVPNIPGAELGFTSNEAFYLPTLPKRVLIVGGGYVAVEFAAIFHGLGSHVTQIHRGTSFLTSFDADLGTFLAAQMIHDGIDLRFHTIPERLEKTASGSIRVTLNDGEPLEVDGVLWATGRRPRLDGLNIEKSGVTVDVTGSIPIDHDHRTNVPHIFAIGDVVERYALTPVAIAQGHVLADLLFGNKQRSVDYDNVPTAIFSTPPIGTVGLSEAKAFERYHGGIDVYKSEFRPLRHTMTGRQRRTLMKLLVDRATDKVVGVHMVGEDAPEILQGFAVALNAGATKADFDRTIGIHPTAAEEFVTMRTPSQPAARSGVTGGKAIG